MQVYDSAGGGWLVVGGTSEASPDPTPVGVIRRCDDARQARADRQHPDLIGAVNSKTREAIPRLMSALAAVRPPLTRDGRSVQRRRRHCRIHERPAI